MSDIKDWSPIAAQNNDAPPDGWPENMLPSDVNNSARENMAAIRRKWEDSAWVDLGHVPTFISTKSFTIPGDVTEFYGVGRRVRLDDSSTLYATIDGVAFTSLTTVTVTLDTGVITGALVGVAVGVLDENSMPPYLRQKPIGALEFGFNPNNIYPGVWEQIAEGTFLMSTIGDSDPSGGSNNAVNIAHGHIADPVGNHTHNITGDTEESGQSNTPSTGTQGGTPTVIVTLPAGAHTPIIQNSGVDGTNLNKPLYIGIEIWRRTS
jgi:hypothetical protein